MPARKERTNLKVGCEFIVQYKRKTYKLTVIKTDGRIAYELGGAVFSSLSAAAKSITKTEVNGWKFWKID
jgi:hypothetical protein